MRTITQTVIASHPAGHTAVAGDPVTAFSPNLRQALCAAAAVLLPYAAMTGILLLNR